ncbi:hypothetical protein ABT352_26110 [Streptosporangium sp. NPDC000563]|uniref:hypothetical protein n=1 Tax=unclassified Streptosporangium TaxID=2632669 RepID=UPI00332A1185
MTTRSAEPQPGQWTVPRSSCSRSAYPRELRERAVRMVGEVRPHYAKEYAAIKTAETS